MIYSYDGFTTLTNADPLDQHAQVLFNKPYIILCFNWQLFEHANISSGLHPAGKSDILDFHLSQIRNGAREIVNCLSMQFVTKTRQNYKKIVFSIKSTRMIRFFEYSTI